MSDDTAQHRLFDLSGGVAIVTGASGWLGTAMVDALARAGARVVAVSRGRDALEAALEAPRSAGLAVEARTCDVSTSEWPRVVADIAAEHGRLDVLVNNAHRGRGGSMATATGDLFDEAWNLSVKSAWSAMQAARPGFAAAREQGGSPSVINVGSIYGLVAPDLSIYATEGDRNPPFYGAAKAALGQLTRYAAAELGPEGVRVNLLVPGPFPQHPESLPAEFLDALQRRALLGRVGAPDDIRTALLFLASPHSGFVTGSTVVVDGGWTAR